MLVLGLETSTAQSSVCLATERGAVASASLARGQSHGEFLVPAVSFCLERAGVGVRDVNGVAVSLGPGLYTGMRVGIATAQMFAHARGLPVVGLASLDLVAFGVRHVRRLICSVLDARRGELFWAFYRSVPGGVQRTSEFRVGPPAKLAGEIESNAEDVLAVGDGALAQRTLLESAGADVASPLFAYPSAAALCELALPRFIREETQRAEDLRPVYLRMADTRIGWAQRGALRGGKPPESANATTGRSS
jgi:tRNA threonylcarbamoyladenosine biosynthesis protein TsaB